MAYYPNNANGQVTSANSAPVVLASDQSEIAAAISSASIIATPTSNSMAALNAAVQYTVDAGANLFLTLTNGPGATTAWSGTVTFQSSIDGSNWSSLSVMPVAAPASSASTSTATANGLFFVQAPKGAAVGPNTIYIRALMSSYTSGTAYFFAASQSTPNTRVMLPWTYTVTSGQTLLGPIEASAFSEIDVQLSAVTTTVITAQGTNDPTLTTWQTIPAVASQAAAASVLVLNAAATYRVQPVGYKWIRLQCTTTGTVLTVQGITGVLGQQLVLTSVGNDVGVTVNSGTVTTVSTVTTVASVTAVAAINSVATTNGLSIGTVVTAPTPATQSIKATAGRLHHISVGNPNTSAVYLKIFNVAAPTLGTTSANMNYLIPASSQTTIPINDVGLFFSTAIVVAVTGGISLTDNTAITSGCAVSYSWI